MKDRVAMEVGRREGEGGSPCTPVIAEVETLFCVFFTDTNADRSGVQPGRRNSVCSIDIEEID